MSDALTTGALIEQLEQLPSDVPVIFSNYADQVERDSLGPGAISALVVGVETVTGVNGSVARLVPWIVRKATT